MEAYDFFLSLCCLAALNDALYYLILLIGEIREALRAGGEADNKC